ncbi:MAG: CPBP family intramembrane metalloprotease, partial [Paludibacteraceae bacterium]|nr:CPBP family intramembrane metalloprotease [Paludibacteraceae bacterium]
MLRGKLNNTKWYSRVALWIGVMAVCMLLTLFIWVIVGNPQETSSLKWFQFWQTMTIFILPVLMAVYLWSEKPLEWLHLDRGMNWQTAITAIGVMLIAIPAINLLSHLNQQVTLPDFLRPLEAWMQDREQDAQVLTERFLQVDSFGGLITIIGLMALLPAIGEELTFRGLLQGLFSPKYKTAAIWIAAAIFSFIHFQFYGFVPRMLMGALFGYMLVWTGSLWVPILMHFTN